jgi:hypothetical protein
MRLMTVTDFPGGLCEAEYHELGMEYMSGIVHGREQGTDG